MAPDAPRPLPRPLRSVRVPTPGLRARFADIEGDLVNVSVSGALIRVRREVPVGSSAQVVLDLEGRRIALAGRVVRSVPTSSTSRDRGGQSTHAIGVMFVETAGAAARAVTELCGGRVALEQLAYGILFLGDQSALNDLIKKTLTEAGYDTHVVRDAHQVLHTARETQADLVIVDLKQEHEPTPWWVLDAFAADSSLVGKSLLVVFDTASFTPERRHYLAEHHIRFLLFPFTPEELLTTVERALRESV